MSEFDGTSDAKDMAWSGGAFLGCLHLMEAREITVEGGVGCANCGALLLPIDETVDDAEKQVKYLVRGSFLGLSIQGEFNERLGALAAVNAAEAHDVFLKAYKVTTEEA